jgi:hypothetical protein
VGTTAGVIVGVGATALAERSRWKRDQGREQAQLRRESYGKYLAAVIQAHEAMRAAAVTSGSSAADRRAAITDAFRSADPYVHRFELSLLAPEDVVILAVAVFRRVREIRDLLITGTRAESADYRAAQRAYYDAIKAMSDAMRLDLGNSPLGAETIGGPPSETGEPEP